MNDSDSKFYLIYDENGDLLMSDNTEPSKQNPQKRRLSKGMVIAVLVPIFVAGMGFYLYTEMLGFLANAQYKHLRAVAKEHYKIAEQWLNEDASHTLTTHIRQCGIAEESDAFSEYLCMYRDESIGWYAMICDSDGKPQYVLYSKKKITEEELKWYTAEETREVLRSPFRKSTAIAAYPDSPQ